MVFIPCWTLSGNVFPLIIITFLVRSLLVSIKTTASSKQRNGFSPFVFYWQSLLVANLWFSTHPPSTLRAPTLTARGKNSYCQVLSQDVLEHNCSTLSLHAPRARVPSVLESSSVSWVFLMLMLCVHPKKKKGNGNALVCAPFPIVLTFKTQFQI